MLQGNRAIAAAQGDRFYMGAPCAHGHDGRRYTSTGGCVECRKKAANDRHEMIRELLRKAREAAKNGGQP